MMRTGFRLTARGTAWVVAGLVLAAGAGYQVVQSARFRAACLERVRDLEARASNAELIAHSAGSRAASFEAIARRFRQMRDEPVSRRRLAQGSGNMGLAMMALGLALPSPTSEPGADPGSERIRPETAAQGIEELARQARREAFGHGNRASMYRRAAARYRSAATRIWWREPPRVELPPEG
jgi:hypothetical protein